MYMVAPAEYGLTEGRHFPLGRTYCSHTLTAGVPIALSEVGRSDLRTHPAYYAFGVEAYVGVPLTVNGERFGTLNFSSRHKRREEFDEAELDFLQAAASLVTCELAHEREKSSLEVANDDLKMFAHAVTHDLRQPLQAVKTCTELLRSERGDALGERGRSDLELIADAAERISESLAGLMRLFHLTEAPLRRSRVNLSQVVRGLARELERGASDRVVTWRIADDVWAEGDQGLLYTMLQNLLVNAWKFTSTHASAEIEFGYELGDDGERIFFVSDDGVGFDMAHAGQLFAPFQRLHRHEAFEGSGLGLATVQRIVHAHLGRVWAKSALEAGASFYFTLG